jgi:hypothetical protein
MRVPGDRISPEYIIQSIPTRLIGCRKAKLKVILENLRRLSVSIGPEQKKI